MYLAKTVSKTMETGEYARMYALEGEHYWYKALQKHVLHYLPQYVALNGAQILDAGCGTGMMARLLADQGARVTGLDSSRDALLLAHTRGIPTLVEGSVNVLPFAAESFDAVVSLDVWYHEGVNDQRAACEVARVLKPGGAVLVNLPAYEGLRGHHDVVIHTARRYNRARVRRLFQKAGLELEFYTHWNTLLFPLLAAKRLGSTLQPYREGEASTRQRLAPRLNRFLTALLSAEEALFPLPYGLSILAVARKLG